MHDEGLTLLITVWIHFYLHETSSWKLYKNRWNKYWQKKLQEDDFKIAEEMLDLDQKILIAEHEDFHEWVVGIVSWKITEKYNKPVLFSKLIETNELL